MTLLELKNIVLQQGTFRLQVPHLKLRAGRLYALKGQNGSGKSTLLRLLALLQMPQSGEAYFAEQPTFSAGGRLRRLRQQITLVEQSPLLFAGSVEKNLAFGLKLRGFSGREMAERIGEALEIVGLGGFQQRSTGELSGGESRRVALARALCLRPQLLLLDEPTANLDAAQVEALESFLTGLPEQGMTVVIATHDVAQPQRIDGERIELIDGHVSQVRSDTILSGCPAQGPDEPLVAGGAASLRI